MSGDVHKTLSAEELGFIETVAASLSHEINNVFAIINELSGLLSDYVASDEQNRPVDMARMKSVLQKIEKNVERGTGHVKQLNRFAHSIDPSTREMDAGRIVSQVAGVCLRLARLRKFDLAAAVPSAPVKVTGSPFELQHMVFRLIEAGLACSDQGAIIKLVLKEHGGEVLLALTTDAAFLEGPEAASHVSYLARMAEGFGGTLTSETAPGRPLEITIRLPNHLKPLSRASFDARGGDTQQAGRQGCE